MAAGRGLVVWWGQGLSFSLTRNVRDRWMFLAVLVPVTSLPAEVMRRPLGDRPGQN